MSNSPVSGILVDFKLEGSGIVNFDSTDQKFMFFKDANKKDDDRMPKVKALAQINDNCSYSKKNFFYNEKGQLDFKVKISAECFNKALFKEDYVEDNPRALYDKNTLYNYLGSTHAILKGYLKATKGESLKRKGPITTGNIQQTCTALPTLPQAVKAGSKKSPISGKGSTSLFQYESLGDIKYSGTSFIDIGQLQFLSCDAAFDRYGFNPDNAEILIKSLNMNLNSTDTKLAYYKLSTSCLDLAEYGIKLNDDNVVYLVKEYIYRLLKTQIKRSNASADVISVRIKLVRDPYVDTMRNPEGWDDIKNVKDIKNISFKPFDFYEEVSGVIVEKTEERINKGIEKEKAIIKEAAEEKALKSKKK